MSHGTRRARHVSWAAEMYILRSVFAENTDEYNVNSGNLTTIQYQRDREMNKSKKQNV